LFIDICDDGVIKYAFTDYDVSKPMTAEEYMTWGEYRTEEDEGSNYSANAKYISKNATLMTPEELEEFMSRSYYNVDGEPF